MFFRNSNVHEPLISKEYVKDCFFGHGIRGEDHKLYYNIEVVQDSRVKSFDVTSHSMLIVY